MANDSQVVVQLRLLGAGQFSKDGRTAIATLKGLDTAGTSAGTGLAKTGKGGTAGATGLTRLHGAAKKSGGVLSGLQGAAAGVFGSLRSLAGPVVALGGAFGFYSLAKGAIQFDQAMRNVNAILRLNTPQFQALEGQVNALAKTTYQAPTTLAGGMRQLVEAGFNASQSLTILESAGKAAFAGQANLTDTTGLLVKVLSAYHLSASDAAKVTDTLFKTTERGPVSFTDLADGIGKLLPVASAVKVPLDQVGAAIDTLSRQMGAGKAMMGLNNIFAKMLKPSTDLQAAIEKTGYHSGVALLQAKGLQGALQLLAGTTGGSVAEMAKLFPGVRSVAAALGLTGANAKNAKNDLAAFSDVSGSTANAMKQMAQTPAGAWQKFKSSAESLGNSLALKLLPPLTGVVNALSDLVSGKGGVGKFLSGLTKGITQGKPPPSQGAPPILAQTSPYGGISVLNQRTMPQISQAQKIGAAIRKVFQDVVKAVRPVAVAMGGVIKAIVGAFKPLLPVLIPVGKILLGVFVVALRATAVAFRIMATVIRVVVTLLGGALTGVIAGAKGAWSGLRDAGKAVGDAFSWLWHNVLSPIAGFIGGVFMAVLTPFKAIWEGIKGAVNLLSDAFNWLWHNVLEPIKGFLAGLLAPINAVVGGLVDIVQGIFNINHAASIQPGNITPGPVPNAPPGFFGGSPRNLGGGHGAMAGGGTLSGGPTLVGEGGPELITGGRGSRVHTAQQTAAMLRSRPIVIHNHTYIDGKEVHSAVYRHEQRLAEAS